MKKSLPVIVGIVVVGLLGWLAYSLVGAVWGQFKQLDPKVSIAILTAAATVLAASITVAVGKYYERKKDIEAHYRTKKTEIYDEFLKEFFDLFHSEAKSTDEPESTEKMVAFLREWQRKMILWGGQGVLSKYIEWMAHLKKGEPDARTMFLTEEFFREIRKDLGHKSNRLPKGTFVHLILREPELMLAMAEKNPNVTLAELAELEEKLKS